MGDAVDTLQCYLRDVRRVALLESEEEQRLAGRIDDGRQAAVALAEPGLSPLRQRDLAERQRLGREARDRMVVAHLRFAVTVARRYVRRGRPHGVELLDLIQEGNLGLLEAVERFESGYGTFAAFAAPWIRRQIHRVLGDRIIRLPAHVREKLDRLWQEEHWYLAEKGRPATPEELAAELGVDVEGLAALRLAEADVESLDRPVPGDEDELAAGDLVEDPEGAAFAQRTEDRQWLAWILAGLDERSRRIVEWRFGHGLTFDEIARRENASREWVRRIAHAGLETLQRVGAG